MTRNTGFFSCLALVAIANALAGLHATNNRRAVEAEIELTERELTHQWHRSNNVVFLRWSWRGAVVPGEEYPLYSDLGRWITESDLRELGFDTSVSPTDSKASSHYARLRPRRAVVALEYNGEAWKAVEQALEKTRAKSQVSVNDPSRAHSPTTRLIAIGVGKDATSLRLRFPDRSKVILMPAVVRIENSGGKLHGRITDLPQLLHVPLPYSGHLRQPNASYRIRVRFGLNLEPWVTAVEPPTQ